MLSNNSKKFLFLFVFFVCITLTVQLTEYLKVKRDYKRNVNFIVYKKENTSRGCYLYDKKSNSLPLESQEFQFLSEIEIGDSIVKKANNDTVYFYRKESENSNLFTPIKRIEIE